MSDDAEWNDIVGMIKVQRVNLGVELLAGWARALDVAETWRQALKVAGRDETSRAWHGLQNNRIFAAGHRYWLLIKKPL
ncbi:hypothetical protein [Ktedonobacter sp. SOSP1-85]|uniref:hypothetical protein n=1 Tax=Ktedonobacter sp. SOSP1-85 TaxID=2778367 RepID=UPI001914E2EA|nr:hypothetical protein [Ktedonobacter sp. SOSP1-85]